MRTHVMKDKQPDPVVGESPPGRPTGNRPGPDSWRNRRWLWVVIGALAAALVAAFVISALVDDDSNDAASPPLQLSLGESDALASCLPFDVQILAGMSPAFAGTVTSTDGEAVTLQVDRWYAGGDAEVVELTGVLDGEALIAGFPFEVGSQYLITAAEGAVNYCGYSGPATPEFTQAFDAAFPG